MSPFRKRGFDVEPCKKCRLKNSLIKYLSKESADEVPLPALRLGRLAARLMADAADHGSRSSSLEDEEDGSSVLVALPDTFSI